MSGVFAKVDEKLGLAIAITTKRLGNCGSGEVCSKVWQQAAIF